MITFKGTGYGHHMGLCQWGARELVNQGWNYKKILHFYYPGTTFMKLCKKESTPPEPEQTTEPESVPAVHAITSHA